jgi:hypothetical protein
MEEDLQHEAMGSARPVSAPTLSQLCGVPPVRIGRRTRRVRHTSRIQIQSLLSSKA